MRRTTTKPVATIHLKLTEAGEVLRDHGEDAALAFAGRLSAGVLREHRDAVQKGAAALSRPDWYRELGQDPDALVTAGKAALRVLLAEAGVHLDVPG